MSLVGNCTYTLAQFGVLVLLARSGTPADVGVYALALAVTAPIQLGLGMRLRTVRAVDISATPFRTYVRTATLMSAFAILLSTAVGVLVTPDPRFVVVVALVALAKGVEGLIDVCYGEYQRQDRFGAIAGSQILRAAATLVLVAVGAHVGGLVGALLAIFLGWSAQLLAFDARRLKASPPLPDSSDASTSTGRALLRLSWPLGVAAAVSSLTVSLPRFTVAGLLDASALGVLAVLTYPTTAISLFANSVGQATVRRMATDVEAGDLRGVGTTLRSALLATSTVGLLGMAVVLVAGRRGVAWLLGTAYADDLGLLLLLVLAATFAGFATNAYYVLVSTGRFGLQPVVVAGSLALALPVVYLATRSHGLVGTAVALVVMYALQAVLTLLAAAVLLNRRRISIEPGGPEG